MLVLCPSTVPRSPECVNNHLHRDQEKSEIFQCNMPPKPKPKLYIWNPLKYLFLFDWALGSTWNNLNSLQRWNHSQSGVWCAQGKTQKQKVFGSIFHSVKQGPAGLSQTKINNKIGEYTFLNQFWLGRVLSHDPFCIRGCCRELSLSLRWPAETAAKIHSCVPKPLTSNPLQ